MAAKVEGAPREGGAFDGGLSTKRKSARAHGCHEKASIALRRQNDLIVVVPSVSSCLLY
nr:MAG TPA: hypothetical protein [Caudoviricetes sp.]